MPTYYTEEPGSFAEFKEKCLKAFKLSDQTTFLANKLAEARRKLCELIFLNEKDIAYEKKYFEEAEVARVLNQTSKNQKLKETYEDLLRQAREWPGPQEVRDFMIQQLELSIKHDIYEPLPAREYSYEDALDNALTNFKYHYESYTEHCVALDKYNELIARSQYEG